MRAPRENARFGGERPRFGPVDRLDALQRVAAAARVQLAAPDDDAWMVATDKLAATVAVLDEIEGYLGLKAAS